MDKIVIENECYINTKLAAAIIGISEFKFRRIIIKNEVEIKFRKIKGINYLNEQKIIQYASSVNWDVFITLKEAKEMLNIDEYSFNRFVSAESNKVINNPFYGQIISKNVILNALSESKYDSVLEMTISDICKHLQLSYGTVERHISRHLDHIHIRKNLLHGYIVSKSLVEEWIIDKNFDTSNYYTFEQTMLKLSINWPGMNMLMRKDKLQGQSSLFYNFLFTKESVDKYQSYMEFLKKDCLSVVEAANELKIGRKYTMGLIRSGLLGELFIYDFKNEWFVTRQEVEEYKISIRYLQDNYYTHKDLCAKYDNLVANNLFKHNKEKGIQQVLVVLPDSEVLRKLLLKADVDRYISFANQDPYFRSPYESFKNAEDVFLCSVSEFEMDSSVKETFEIYCEFALNKMKKSIKHSKFHEEGRKYSNFIKKLCKSISGNDQNVLLPIRKNIWLYSHEEIDQQMQLLSGKDISIFQQFLRYVLKIYKEKCEFGDVNWKIVKINKKSNPIIVSEELYNEIEANLINVQIHLSQAVSNRFYAMNWLFLLLHFFIGWRAGDKANLAFPDLKFIRKDGGIVDFTYVLNQGLSLDEAYRIRSQYHYTDLRANKSKYNDRVREGKELNFTVKRSHLIVLMTAITLCTLHMHEYGYKHLICDKRGVCAPIPTVSSRRFIKRSLSHLTNSELNTISSSSLCNTFMSRLLYKAAEDGKNSNSSLILTQASRGHARLGNTMIEHYIAQLKDGPWSNLLVSLCNETFFGGAKLKLIESIISLCGFKPVDSYENKTKMIGSIDQVLNGITGAEQFATMVNTIQTQKVNLAIKIIKQDICLIDEEEFRSCISALVRGEMPAKIRDAQCLVGGVDHCPFPLNSSCKGCDFLLPEDLILISIGNELRERVTRMALASHLGQLQKEFIWIYRLLKLVQEAAEELGEEVTLALIPHYHESMETLELALKNKRILEYELTLLGE
ncbi:hypothetical protein SAMN04487969_1513 [Paenibacillus algorifonticola]|uniref:Uncharacterized protein n=1 Tax=Paenibacillus algorifonticola TaxID=684063 RepID=A0A1I2J344_9BACL|nr:hypothetical protein [Paenibacillus algorifonticola]SFF48430.1 hypothetical protein SAMN04487969_1513 [Paenibacillus algorifonticola]